MSPFATRSDVSRCVAGSEEGPGRDAPLGPLWFSFADRKYHIRVVPESWRMCSWGATTEISLTRPGKSRVSRRREAWVARLSRRGPKRVWSPLRARWLGVPGKISHLVSLSTSLGGCSEDQPSVSVSPSVCSWLAVIRERPVRRNQCRSQRQKPPQRKNQWSRPARSSLSTLRAS